MINYKYLPTIYEKIIDKRVRMIIHRYSYKEHDNKFIQRSINAGRNHRQIYNTATQRNYSFMRNKFIKVKLDNKYSNKFFILKYKTPPLFFVNSSVYNDANAFFADYKQYVFLTTTHFGYKRCEIVKCIINRKLLDTLHTYYISPTSSLKVYFKDNKIRYTISRPYEQDYDVTNWFNTMGITEEELFSADEYMLLFKLKFG